MSDSSARRELVFKVKGMDCADEIATLRRELSGLVGGDENLTFDLLNGKMTVRSDVAEQRVVKAVATTGMRATPVRPGVVVSPETGWTRHGRMVLTAVSASLSVGGFIVHSVLAGGVGSALGSEGMGVAESVPWPARLLYLAGIAVGASHVVPKALFALRRRRPDMNLLMTIAVLGAIAIGEWFEAATVTVLFSLSLALESWSVGRARRAVEKLLTLAPPVARVRGDDGHEREVLAADVPVGAVIVVRPGDRVPLDGVVRSGASEVNQAPITGESVPVPKTAGAEVFAGTINGDGTLDVESTKAASETALAHIIRLVEKAQGERSPAERWVDRFAAVYTPAVLSVAVLVFLIPPLAFGGVWSEWLYRALVLLVIGCPCALVISTPVCVVAALASCARNGVLVKGGEALEAPARVAAIALDKTGTLTEGRPRVVEVVAVGCPEAELIANVGSLESQSSHPLARALVEYARDRGARLLPVAGFEILQGRGASGIVDGRRYWLGSHRLLAERGQETAVVRERLEQLAGAGRTVVIVGDDTHVCGFFALADGIRPRAAEIVDALRTAGVKRVVMLTGDNRATAEAVGKATGVDEVRAELLPADKVAAIDELVRSYGSVAMVGDGVNDAPALAKASLGIAMGAVGSDAAIETADVALLSDDLAKVPWLIGLSRRTLGIIRANVVFSLAVKALFVVLAVAGVASLWSAIAADMGASLIVIANGLRLLRD